MQRNWTQSQLDAIESRRGTILVSAAAGSGKTAVLVERAVRRLTVGENPTPADKLLIVTFTKAAAAEMRARLEKRLSELRHENPADEWLRRQSILLSQATIGTAHSFCADLIREHFHTLNIPHEFKIVTDNQELEMKTEAVSEVLDEAFETDDFKALADAFTEERSDRKLSEIILSLYKYMQSHPSPNRWLQNRVAMFKKSKNAASSPWGEVILRYVAEAAEYMRNLINEAQHASMEDEDVQKAFGGVLGNEEVQISALCELTKSGTWDEIAAMIKGLVFGSRGQLRGMDKGYPPLAKAAKLRDEAKETRKKLEKLFSSNEEECLDEFAEIARITEKLTELVLRFDERYKEKKLEKGFLDYNDLEHYAVELLADDEGNPTPVAEEISLRFEEVMIDEYQDINEVQDLIFRCVSRDEANLFMVGDVKQSIYGFRCAEPRIFINRRNSYEKYEREKGNYPSYIVLDYNFRSRENVTESVNFVFSNLMSKETGDIDYTDEEKLACGADYDEKAGCETELYILKKQEEFETEIIEANFIAECINELIKSGFTVKDKESGEERQAAFSDFAVLLRSANRYAHNYAEILTAAGIPARANIAGGFFEAQEIRLMLSILKVIDNPNQDIPLLALMLSPIYGFSPDDMAKLRMNDKSVSLYISVLRQAKNDERYERLIRDLEEYRTLAATMPADTFISMLYLKTGYTDIVLAMEEGDSRLSNLRLLQRYAKEYEGFGHNGISGFIRFIDKMKQNKQSVEAVGKGEKNCVSVMSVHKSKGLEFPVCIVAGCGRGGANRTDEVLLHPELGLGIKIRDNRLGARFTTMPRDAIALDLSRREAAEELRILYVAMTRAREKLILIGTDKNPDNEIAKAAAQIAENGITPYAIKNAKNFLQLLIMCALRHQNGEILRSKAGIGDEMITSSHYVPWKIEIVERLHSANSDAEELRKENKTNEELVKEITRRVDFTYPFDALTEIPSKVTASGLVSKEHGEASEVPLRRPAWLGIKGFSPVERGTALHEFMQYADFGKAAENPQAELDALLEKGFLTEAQAQVIDFAKVKKFFESDLGRRVLASTDVQKEKRFAVEIAAGSVMEDLSDFKGEKIILQGAIDCTFTENGKISIIDFKTDNVKTAEELLPIYKTQLQLYAAAIKATSGGKVGDCFIYSIKTGEYVKADIQAEQI